MTNDDELNQMGAVTPPAQSGNYLSPQQKQQMAQYGSSLMAPKRVSNFGQGLAQLGQSMVGGYLQNQASPWQGGQPFWQNLGQNQPMQLSSAGGGQDQAQSIFSGLFGGTP